MQDEIDKIAKGDKRKEIFPVKRKMGFTKIYPNGIRIRHGFTIQLTVSTGRETIFSMEI